jgi:hypothetical protein
MRLDTTPPQTISEDISDEIRLPPTNLYSDEPPLETDFHRNQIDLLIRLLKSWGHKNWRTFCDRKASTPIIFLSKRLKALAS